MPTAHLQPRPAYETPDIYALLACTNEAGLSAPTFNDYCCVLGCFLREVGKIGEKILALEIAEPLPRVCPGPDGAQTHYLHHALGLPIPFGTQISPPRSIPPCFVVAPPAFAEDSSEAVIVAVLSDPDDDLPQAHLLTRSGYFDLLAKHGVSTHKATHMFFNFIYQAILGSERRDLFAEDIQRLQNIAAQLTAIFAPYRLPW